MQTFRLIDLNWYFKLHPFMSNWTRLSQPCCLYLLPGSWQSLSALRRAFITAFTFFFCLDLESYKNIRKLLKQSKPHLESDTFSIIQHILGHFKLKQNLRIETIRWQHAWVPEATMLLGDTTPAPEAAFATLSYHELYDIQDIHIIQLVKCSIISTICNMHMHMQMHQ